MSHRHPRGDAGAAAVEMALVSTLLLTLISFIVPLSILFYENVQLGRTAGDTIRFASSRTVDSRISGNADGTVPAGFLPGTTAIQAEVPRVHNGLYSATLDGSPRRIPDTTCPSGFRRQITVQTTTNLGPLNLLLPDSVTTLRATATSCEE